MTTLLVTPDKQIREEFIAYRENQIGKNPFFWDQFVAYLRSDDCSKDIRRLMDGEYFIDPPTRILLKKKYSEKKRVVFRHELRDKFLLILMGFVLHDYDDIFSESLYSFRRQITAGSLITKIKLLDDIESKWVLKTDFKSFGESINVKILYEQLEKIMSDDIKFLSFIKKFLLDKRYFWRGKLIDDDFCLKTGSPLTNFFENVYAMEIDDIMTDISILYGRYGDDIVAFFNSEREAINAKEKLSQAMKKLGLSFNERKTSITGPEEPIEVLGLKITGREVDIADSSIEKIKYRYKRKAKKLLIMKRKNKLDSELMMRDFINFVNRRFFYLAEDRHELNWCRWAFPIITRVNSLKEIDHIIQDCIRYLGSGKKSDSKYRIRYKQMQQLGYRSLVHYFYHREKFTENPYIPEVLDIPYISGVVTT